MYESGHLLEKNLHDLKVYMLFEAEAMEITLDV